MLHCIVVTYLATLLYINDDYTASAAPTSAYVYLKPGTTTGELVYRHLDNNNNTIMDFSAVGYAGGEEEIPFVSAKRFLSPSGDEQQDGYGTNSMGPG